MDTEKSSMHPIAAATEVSRRRVSSVLSGDRSRRGTYRAVHDIDGSDSMSEGVSMVWHALVFAVLVLHFAAAGYLARRKEIQFPLVSVSGSVVAMAVIWFGGQLRLWDDSAWYGGSIYPEQANKAFSWLLLVVAIFAGFFADRALPYLRQRVGPRSTSPQALQFGSNAEAFDYIAQFMTNDLCPGKPAIGLVLRSLVGEIPADIAAASDRQFVLVRLAAIPDGAPALAASASPTGFTSPGDLVVLESIRTNKPVTGIITARLAPTYEHGAWRIIEKFAPEEAHG